MIRYHSQKQLSLADFEWPFQTALDENNRWVKLGAINQTLRVVETADGREKTQYALQYLINQHPDNLLILPEGKHKKTDALQLSDICPRKVPRQARTQGKTARRKAKQRRQQASCKPKKRLSRVCSLSQQAGTG